MESGPLRGLRSRPTRMLHASSLTLENLEDLEDLEDLPGPEKK